MEQKSKLGGTWTKSCAWIVIAAVITLITVTAITGAYFCQHQRSKFVFSQESMLIKFFWH
jgi:CHASE1-domain containing sensor protein